MNDIIETPSIDLGDALLQEIATHVSRAVELAGFKATAHLHDPVAYPMPQDAGALENLILERVRTLGSQRRQQAMKQLDSFMRLPQVRRERRFLGVSGADLRSAKPMLAHPKVARLSQGLAIDREHLEHMASSVDRRAASDLAAAPHAAAAGAPEYDRLSVRLHEVKCVDETNPESGHDKISLGCLSIDETGDVTKIDAFNVSDTFDDGDSKTYNPPRELAGFNIREGGDHWPKQYRVVIVLAERDFGGFPEFLVNAAKKLKEYILGLLDGAVGVVLGELASIVASLVAHAIEAVIRWLRELWQDDVFPAISDEVAMHSLDQHFATGTRTSSIRTRSTTAHGGKYRVRFDWHLTT